MTKPKKTHPHPKHAAAVSRKPSATPSRATVLSAIQRDLARALDDAARLKRENIQLRDASDHYQEDVKALRGTVVALREDLARERDRVREANNCAEDLIAERAMLEAAADRLMRLYMKATRDAKALAEWSLRLHEMTDLGRRAQNASSEYAAAAAGSLARVNKMLDAMVHAFVDSNNVSISTVYRMIDPDGHANHDHSNLRVPATELGGRFRKLLADAMRREAPTGAEYLGKDVSDSALFAEADVRPVWLRSVREGEPTPQPALDRWVVGESFYGPLVELQPTKVAGTIEVDEEVSP